MNKVVVYTATFGEKHGVVPQKKIEGVDFVCFTDALSKVKGAWKPILFDNDNVKSDHLKNRHIKLLPHLYFQNYETSIYIDSNYLVVNNVLDLLKDLGSFQMAIFDHNQCEDARDCIYDEYDAIIELGSKKGNYKDEPSIMKSQMDFFKSENYPRNNGLIFAAVLIRKHNNPEVIKLMEDWWSIVSTRSKRDQLSFDFVAWKNNFSPTVLNGDLRKKNAYFYYLGDNRRNYTKKMILYTIGSFFGLIKHPK